MDRRKPVAKGESRVEECEWRSAATLYPSKVVQWNHAFFYKCCYFLFLVKQGLTMAGESPESLF